MGDKPLKIIRGDTFYASATYTDPDDVPVNLTTAGITVEAFARNPDGTAEIELTVDLANQATDPGEFIVTGDTAEWVPESPRGANVWNVRLRYTSALGRFSSEALDVALIP